MTADLTLAAFDWYTSIGKYAGPVVWLGWSFGWKLAKTHVPGSWQRAGLTEFASRLRPFVGPLLIGEAIGLGRGLAHEPFSLWAFGVVLVLSFQFAAWWANRAEPVDELARPSRAG